MHWNAFERNEQIKINTEGKQLIQITKILTTKILLCPFVCNFISNSIKINAIFHDYGRNVC